MSEHISAIDDDERRGGRGDPLRFIRESLRPVPVPSLPGVRLYGPHAGTGLSRLGGAAPYWAYPWAGGMALARYVAERPETVAGRRVVDFGSGSGLVAIVAARHDASDVLAVDADPFARAAIAANAALNEVDVTVAVRFEHAAADVVLAGDVFYAANVGRRALAILERCRTAGIAVLVGDPYRAHLPAERFRCIAEYAVPDVGSGTGIVPGGVFILEPTAG